MLIEEELLNKCDQKTIQRKIDQNKIVFIEKCERCTEIVKQQKITNDDKKNSEVP
jgi:hypothetical protein